MVRNFLIWNFVFIAISQAGAGQTDSTNIVFFDAAFEAVNELEFAHYYGTPVRIKDNRYEITFYTMTGQKIAMGEYLGNSLRNKSGYFVRYNSEGKIFLSITYHKSMMHGIFLRWHDNGQLADSGRMERSNAIGVWKSWHRNGQLKDIRNNIVVRRRSVNIPALDKEYRSYYDNGHPRDSGLYKEGLRTGVWFEWIEGGIVRSMGWYKNGWRIGDWRYYDEKGKLLYLRRFKKGRYDMKGELIQLK